MAFTARLILIPKTAATAAMTFADSAELLDYARKSPDQFVAREIRPDGTSSELSLKSLGTISPGIVSLLKPPDLQPPKVARRFVPVYRKLSGIVLERRRGVSEKPLKEVCAGSPRSRERL